MREYKTKELIDSFEVRNRIKEKLPEPKSDYIFFTEWRELKQEIESELTGVIR